MTSVSAEPEATRRGALRRAWRLFPRAARYLRPYKGQVATSLVITVLLALVALAEPWPLAFLIDSVLGEKSPPEWVTNVFGETTGNLIMFAVVATLAITLLGGGMRVINSYILTKLSGRMTLELRSDLFRHVQRLSISHHEDLRAGQMTYRMTSSTEALEQLVGIPNLIKGVLTMLGMAWIVYRLDPPLAGLAIIVAPLLYFTTTYYANRIEPSVVRVRAMESMNLSIAHEALAMVRVITSFGRERHEYDKFRTQGEGAVDARVRLTVRQTMFNLAVGLITAIGTAAVLGFGAHRVINGDITAGELLVIMAYLAQVYMPLESLTNFLIMSQEAFINFQYALDLLDTQPEVTEPPGAISLGRSKATLELEHVGFDYPERPDVLRNISFRVDAGKSVAVVGPTGAGKSSLLSLLPRFHDPAEGRVFVDGIDVRDITLESLRAQFSIVLQEPLLFTGTIRENIRYGRLDATDEEVAEAAKAANAHDFITRLPDGYDTQLGERGTKVSGGERQRIAVARAFLRDAPILILDEPTSSIDSKTEGVILDALDRLMEGRTTIMVAHRLSTVRNVDHIFVLDAGGIVQGGTHDELVAQPGLYRQLWEAQGRGRWRHRATRSTGPMILEWRLNPDRAAELASTEMDTGRHEPPTSVDWRPAASDAPEPAVPAAATEPPAPAQRQVWEWARREHRWREVPEHGGKGSTGNGSTGNGSNGNGNGAGPAPAAGSRRARLVTVATAFAEPWVSARRKKE